MLWPAFRRIIVIYYISMCYAFSLAPDTLNDVRKWRRGVTIIVIRGRIITILCLFPLRPDFTEYQDPGLGDPPTPEVHIGLHSVPVGVFSDGFRSEIACFSARSTPSSATGLTAGSHVSVDDARRSDADLWDGYKRIVWG